MSLTTTETETAVRSLTLPLSAAVVNGFAALIPHASTDGVAPVLTGAQIDGRYAVTTDRYSIGRFEHTPEDTAANVEPFTIPAEALAWIGKLKLAEFPRLDALLVITPTRVAVTYFDDTRAALTYDELTGNYPPVQRLFPSPTADKGTEGVPAVAFSSAIFTKLGKTGAALTRGTRSAKGTNIVLTFAAENPQPSSVHFRIGSTFDGLIVTAILPR